MYGDIENTEPATKSRAHDAENIPLANTEKNQNSRNDLGELQNAPNHCANEYPKPLSGKLFRFCVLQSISIAVILIAAAAQFPLILLASLGSIFNKVDPENRTNSLYPVLFDFSDFYACVMIIASIIVCIKSLQILNKRPKGGEKSLAKIFLFLTVVWIFLLIIFFAFYSNFPNSPLFFLPIFDLILFVYYLVCFLYLLCFRHKIKEEFNN